MLYEDLIKEEGIDKAALPKEIKHSINGLNMLIAKNTKTPTEALQQSVERTDISIADSIQTWIEKDFPEEGEETPEELAERNATEQAEILAELEKEMANKIITSMNANPERCIHVSELATILGRTPNEKETVSSLSIKKVYLKKVYKVC